MLFQLTYRGCNTFNSKHTNLQTPQVEDLHFPNILKKIYILMEAKSHTLVHIPPRQAVTVYKDTA